MIMESIIIVFFIKLMGAAISGHWDLGDTGTSRDYARLPIWLCPLTAKRANNQGENVHISNSTTPIVLTLVSGESSGIALPL